MLGTAFPFTTSLAYVARWLQSLYADRTSTTGEWLDHPAGREVLMEALRTSDVGDLTFVLDDPERVRMLSSFPLARLTPMFGGLLPDDFLDRLLGRVAATPAASGG